MSLETAELEELKKLFSSDENCQKAIFNAESYLQRHISVIFLDKKFSGEVLNNQDKILEKLHRLKCQELSKSQEEIREMLQYSSYELSSAVEALNYQIIHAIHNINVSSFSFKNQIEEPSDLKTLNFINLSVLINSLALIGFGNLKNLINEFNADIDLKVFIEFFNFIYYELNFDVPIKFEKMYEEMNLNQFNNKFSNFFNYCNSNLNSAKNTLINPENITRQFITIFVKTVMNELKEKFLNEIDFENEDKVGKKFFNKEPQQDELCFMMKVPSNDSNLNVFIDLRDISLANTIDLSKLQKNLRHFATPDFLSLINENQLKICFGCFSFFSYYLIDSLKFFHAKIISLLSDNCTIINAKSVIFKYKILAENSLKFLKANISIIKPLFDNNKIDLIKELFQFEDFSDDYDSNIIEKYPNFENTIEDYLQKIELKNLEIYHIKNDWENECEKIISKRNDLFEENTRRKNEQYLMELNAYKNKIEQCQSQIDKLISDLHHERCFDNNCDDQFNIFSKLKEVAKRHENFKLDRWFELFPKENLQANKIFIQNNAYFSSITYQKKYEDGTYSKEEPIGYGDLYLSDLVFDLRRVISIKIIVYKFYYNGYNRESEGEYTLENLKKTDYHNEFKSQYYTIMHKPIIKPKNIYTDDNKILEIIIYRSLIKNDKKVYTVKTVDIHDNKNPVLPEKTNYHFNIDELISSNIKEIRIGIYDEKILKQTKTHRYVINVVDLKPGYYLESKYFKINYPILFNEYSHYTHTSHNIQNDCDNILNWLKMPSEPPIHSNSTEKTDREEINKSNDSVNFNQLHEFCENKLSKLIAQTKTKTNNSFDEFNNTFDEIYKDIDEFIKRLEGLKVVNEDNRRICIDEIKPDKNYGINSCFTNEMLKLRNKKKSFILDLLNLMFNLKTLISIRLMLQNFDQFKKLKNSNEIDSFENKVENEIKMLAVKDNQIELKAFIELAKRFFPLIIKQKKERIIAIQNALKEEAIFLDPCSYDLGSTNISKWFQLSKKKVFSILTINKTNESICGINFGNLFIMNNSYKQFKHTLWVVNNLSQDIKCEFDYKNPKNTDTVLVFSRNSFSIPAKSKYQIEIELNSSKEREEFKAVANFNFYDARDSKKKFINCNISANIKPPYLLFDKQEIDFGCLSLKNNLTYNEYLRIENPTNSEIEVRSQFGKGSKFKSFIGSDFLIPANGFRYFLIYLNNDAKHDSKSELRTNLTMSIKNTKIAYNKTLKANFENEIMVTCDNNDKTIKKPNDKIPIRYFKGYQKIIKKIFQISNCKNNHPLTVEFSSKLFNFNKNSFILLPKQIETVEVYCEVNGESFDDFISIRVNEFELYKIQINLKADFDLDIKPVTFHINTNELQDMFSKKTVLFETKTSVVNKSKDSIKINFTKTKTISAEKTEFYTFPSRQTTEVPFNLFEITSLTENNEFYIKAITDTNENLEIPYKILVDKSHLELSNNGALYLGLLVLQSTKYSDSSKAFKISNKGSEQMNLQMLLNEKQLDGNKHIPLKVYHKKDNRLNEVGKCDNFNIGSKDEQEYSVKVSLNSSDAKPGYYFQKIYLFTKDDLRLQPNEFQGKIYQRNLTFFWKVIKETDLKNSIESFNLSSFSWNKVDQKVVYYKNIDQTELIELTYPSLRIAFMLEGKSESAYPKTIAEYANIVAPKNNELKEKIKKDEEEEYFKTIGGDFRKATKIAKMYFDDYTKNMISSDNMYLYEAFSHLLSVPPKKGEIKIDFIENTMQIILSTINIKEISEAFYLFSEKFSHFFGQSHYNELSKICQVINGFVYSDQNLMKSFGSIAKMFEKIFQHEDEIFNFISTKLLKNEYIKQINDLIVNKSGQIQLISLMNKEEQTLVNYFLNQNKKEESKTLMSSYDAIITYLNLMSNFYPKLQNEINKIKLFFTAFEDDMSNFEQHSFECLKIFFNQQEIDFFKNIIVGLSLLIAHNSINDTSRSFILKLSLKIITYASSDLFVDNLKYFEEFLTSSEVNLNKLKKDGERKTAAKKYFKFYNEKMDNVMKKVLNANRVSDVLESYLEYVYLSNGKSATEIYKVESILCQFLSIEPLISMKRCYSIWPYFIYISHLKQNNNEIILNISNSLKTYYNSPNLLTGLNCIKLLTVYLSDQKNSEMNELNDKVIKLEQGIINKNLNINSVTELMLNNNRLSALKNFLELLNGYENMDKSPKFTVPILINPKSVDLFRSNQNAILMINECDIIIQIETEIYNKRDADDDCYRNVNNDSLPKFLNLLNSIINLHLCENNEQKRSKIPFSDFKNYIESIFHATFWFKENPLNFFTYLASAIVSYLTCISKVYEFDGIKEEDVKISIQKSFDEVLKSFDDKVKFSCIENVNHEVIDINKDMKSILGENKNEIIKLSSSLDSLENSCIKSFKNLNINDKSNLTLESVDELASNYFYSLPILMEASNKWLNIFEAFSDIVQTNEENRNFQKIGKRILHSAVSILHYSNAFDHIYKLVSNISIYEIILDLQNIKEKLDRLPIDNEKIKDLIKPGPLIRLDLKKQDEDYLNINEYLNNKFNQNNVLNKIQNDSSISHLNKDDDFSEHLLIHKLNESAKNFMITDNTEGKKIRAKQAANKSKSGKNSEGQANTDSKIDYKKPIDAKDVENDKQLKDKLKGHQQELDNEGISTRKDDTINLEETKKVEIDKESLLKKPEQWTYTMLKDSKALMNITLEMVKSVMNTYHDFIEKNNQINQIEWCIFVDNSISVKPKANSIIQSLVVLCEVLRRLECKFAVAKFGDPKDRKSLLKGFDDQISLRLGEQIIESLTFDQGTVPASCLQNVCEKLWPKEKKANYQYHIVISITDGIILQNDATIWKEIITNYQLQLGFVFLNKPLEKFLQMIENLNLKCQYRISKPTDENNPLALDCFDLMNEVFKNALETQKEFVKRDPKSPIIIKCVTPSIEEKQKPIIEIDKLKYNFNLEDAIKDGNLNLHINSNIKANSMFTTSCSKKINQTTYKEINSRIQIEPEELERLITSLQDYYNQLEKNSEFSTDIETCLKSWSLAESLMNKEISDYEEVLEDVILPNNKFTRRKADSKGSSLYLPGLIKAIASDFTYTKIFANKISGGCRNYNIIFIVDLSYSMHGPLQESAFLSLFCMITALVRMNIETFSIILFAERVKIVKLESQCWDKIAIYTLLSNLQCDDQYGTADVAALKTALNLFNFSANSGPKKIFMFTDGFSSYPSSLKSIISEIDERGIELVAISIGCDRFMVQNYYTKYITCVLPYSVHKALRALYEQDDINESYKDTDLKNIRNSLIKSGEDISTILKNRENNLIFRNMINELLKDEHERLEKKVILMGENINCELLLNKKNCKCKDCMKTIELKIIDKYYNKIAGYNDLDPSEKTQILRDNYGNLVGNTYDLCPDYAFKGENIAVLHLYTGEGFDFSLPKAALEKKGLV